MEKITFIIAHHNYQQYLGRAILSALNQTYPNIHVCVVDDCSDDCDAARDIAKELAGGEWESIDLESKTGHLTYHSDKITYIQMLSGTDQSYKQAYARNRGMETCWDDTDIFAILDADDENYPTKIEQCIKPLLKYPEHVGAVYTDTNIVMVENNRLVREYREPFDYQKLLRECIVHSGCVISKRALEAVLENGKVFDEELPPCEDYDLWIRIAEKFLIWHIPEPLVYVRVHPQNSTNTSTHEHRMSRIQRIHEKRAMRT